MRSLSSNNQAAVLLAGGTGSRFSDSRPKQFYDLAGRDVLDYSLEILSEVVDHVCLVVHPEWMEYVRDRYKSFQNCLFAKGGETRQASVLSGLNALASLSPHQVCIHDGARPLCSIDLFRASLDSAREKGSGIAAIPVQDTLGLIAQEQIRSFPDRAEMVHIQTPQSFSYPLICQAHEEALSQGRLAYTDDSQVYLAAGHPVYWIEGESTNIKITRALDLELAAICLDRLKTPGSGI